jgi:hypothetical protein
VGQPQVKIADVRKTVSIEIPLRPRRHNLESVCVPKIEIFGIYSSIQVGITEVGRQHVFDQQPNIHLIDHRIPIEIIIRQV